MSTQTVSQTKIASSDELYMSFELGDKKWKLTASDGQRAPSRYNVEAGDTATVAYCTAKARNRCKLGPQARVHCCWSCKTCARSSSSAVATGRDGGSVTASRSRLFFVPRSNGSLRG